MECVDIHWAPVLEILSDVVVSGMCKCKCKRTLSMHTCAYECGMCECRCKRTLSMHMCVWMFTVEIGLHECYTRVQCTRSIEACVNVGRVHCQ